MRPLGLKMVLAGAAATVLLTGGSVAAMATVTGLFGPGGRSVSAASPWGGSGACAAPRLPGSVVDVTLTDPGAHMRTWAGNNHPDAFAWMMGGRASGQTMGAPMMGAGPAYGRGSPGWRHDYATMRRMMGDRWRGHMMQVRLDRHSVAPGTVSLRVSDVGAMTHELVVLPLPAGARAGERSVGPDGTVDERGSLGEVSNDCGADEGAGLRPGGAGWTTLQLRPGRYELLCNLSGHYAAGMFAELDVTR